MLLIFLLTWPSPCRGLSVLWMSWSTLWQQPKLIPRCCRRPPSECNLYPGKTSWQEHPGWPGNINRKFRDQWDCSIKIHYEWFNIWRPQWALRVSYLIYLGAVHKLPCQAYVLHTAGTQQGLNKDLQQSGRRGNNVLTLSFDKLHCTTLNSVVQVVETHSSVCEL